MFFAIKNVILGDTVAVLVHNMRSRPRHVGYILSSKRVIYNDIIGFTQTQIKLSKTGYQKYSALVLKSPILSCLSEKTYKCSVPDCKTLVFYWLNSILVWFILLKSPLSN